MFRNAVPMENVDFAGQLMAFHFFHPNTSDFRYWGPRRSRQEKAGKKGNVWWPKKVFNGTEVPCRTWPSVKSAKHLLSIVEGVPFSDWLVVRFFDDNKVKIYGPDDLARNLKIMAQPSTAVLYGETLSAGDSIRGIFDDGRPCDAEIKLVACSIEDAETLKGRLDSFERGVSDHLSFLTRSQFLFGAFQFLLLRPASSSLFP